MGIETMEIGHEETPAKGRAAKPFPWDAAPMFLGAAGIAAVFAGILATVVYLDTLLAERTKLVGRCFDNGIGATGRLVKAQDIDDGLLAFRDGHTTSYPFTAIREVPCP